MEIRSVFRIRIKPKSREKSSLDFFGFHLFSIPQGFHLLRKKNNLAKMVSRFIKKISDIFTYFYLVADSLSTFLGNHNALGGRNERMA